AQRRKLPYQNAQGLARKRLNELPRSPDPQAPPQPDLRKRWLSTPLWTKSVERELARRTQHPRQRVDGDRRHAGLSTAPHHLHTCLWTLPVDNLVPSQPAPGAG